MKLGQNTKSRSLIIMNNIPSVYDVIVTGYENHEKLKFTVKLLPICLNLDWEFVKPTSGSVLDSQWRFDCYKVIFA